MRLEHTINQPSLLRNASWKKTPSLKRTNNEPFNNGFSDAAAVASISCLQHICADSATLDAICALIKEKSFRAGTNIMREGEPTQAALYIVRSGICRQTTTTTTVQDEVIVTDGEVFGEDHLLIDVGKSRRSSIDHFTLAELSDAEDSILFDDDDDIDCEIASSHSVVALEDTFCGVLYLEDMKSVIDTSRIGRQATMTIETISQLGDVKRHSILGQGAFGQVWLASVQSSNKKDYNEESSKTAYALKIQSKHGLIRSRQAKSAVREMEIISKLNHHQFILPLVKTFQDENFIYMLLGYIPGGELERQIHTKTTDSLPEVDARFYAAGILEALLFMHKQEIVYRDLKPENVLIDDHGYPVLIDFGFAKHIPDDKTFTRCGSPSYMAPEVIKVNCGYGVSADYWSYGCLIHEMITGDKPFEGHPTELALYRAICTGYIDIHSTLMEPDKSEALNLIERLLVVDPSERLGTAATGDDVVHHPWFQNNIDFCSLQKKAIPSPWTPKKKNAFDVSYYKDNTTNLQDITEMTYPRINGESQEIFSYWDYS